MNPGHITLLAVALLFAGKDAPKPELPPLPAGYARLSKHALDREPWRNEDKSGGFYVRCQGDFDGDGKPDTAEIARNVKEDSFTLLVKFGKAKEWQEGFDIGDSYFDLGIKTAPKGHYQTACGKGQPGACDHNAPKAVNLKTAGIDVFWQGAAETLYYWDARKKAFTHASLSY